MRTTIALPDDLLRRAKARAALSGMTLKDLITQYVVQGLQQSELPEASSSRRPSPLPVFRSGPARPIPALSHVEIQTMLGEEDQVTLPSELVKALELTPGTQLRWEIGPNQTLIATPLPSRTRRVATLMGSGRRYLRPGADPIADLIAERLQDEESTEV